MANLPAIENKPIYVTQPSLPDLNTYTKLLEGVWERGILTHNGPLVQSFEKQLEKRLALSRFVAVSNGTIALQMAIKALALKGEILISSFTWIATVSAIKWEGCTPVCCDIDPETLNLDVDKAETMITENTVAIMPVHVFGNPCDVEAIEALAKKYNLRVIYDAAHAIGSTWKNESVLKHGDISATSLHATKLLNTGEGGGVITSDPELSKKLERIRFFGHNEEKDVIEDGFNGKMTEIHAALGLANLDNYDAVLEDRRVKYHTYQDLLSQNTSISFQKTLTDAGNNYSYFPIILKSEQHLDHIVSSLASENIYPRRYFYPAVNTYSKILEYIPTPISEDISKRILCLPLYFSLDLNSIYRICDIINHNS